VGLTVMAFGTSAPELLVAIEAVLGGLPGIALGNVVGSNIANILLVLGIPALIVRLRSGRLDVAQSYVMMLAATAGFIGLAFLGPFRAWSGTLLLAGLAATLWHSYGTAQAHRSRSAATGAPEGDGAAAGDPVAALDGRRSGWRIAGLLAIGLVGLPLGARLLVDGASAIAREAGISEAVIGLTLVALGTSLPELATTVMAALRGSADVALGNVIGSNLFNLLGIVGISTLIAPIPVEPDFLSFDLWVMLAASLAVAPFVLRQRDIGRRAGALLIGGYAAYVVTLLA
jgi:cation:H+ antiporter